VEVYGKQFNTVSKGSIAIVIVNYRKSWRLELNFFEIEMVQSRWPMVRYEDGLFYANCGASLLYFKYTNNLLIICQPFHKNDSTYLWGPKERMVR
jgi:hypothetical protein